MGRSTIREMFGLPAKATLWARMAAPALRAVQSNAGDLPLAPEREGGCLSGHGNVRGIWSNFCWINDYHPVCLCLSQCDHSLTSTEAPFPIIPFALVDTPRPAFWPTQLNHTAPHRTSTSLCTTQYRHRHHLSTSTAHERKREKRRTRTVWLVDCLSNSDTSPS